MTPRGAARGSAVVMLLASCTPAPRAPTPAVIATAAAPPVCRVGPDDGPPLAERGIGGTGAPTTQLAERGIGGTGIIGVITGFASVCLAGREVALPAGVPVEIGGVPADPRALRAGQVAAIEAGGSGVLTARRIAIRYEVSGPIESVTADRVQVAGQPVLLGPDTWLRTPPAIGQWVAVSGLRNATGAVVATRLDLVSTRTVLIHGIVQRIDGEYRLGTLPLRPPPGDLLVPDLLVPGLPVSVTGVYGDDGFQAASVTRDLLVADPGAYFGTYTSNFIVEGYAQPINGQIPFGTQSFAPASSRPVGSERSVATFQRTAGGVRLDSVVTSPNGSLRLQPANDGRFQPAPIPSRLGAGSGGRFAPAPVPNRSVGGSGGRDTLPDPTGRLGGADRAGGMRSPNGPLSNPAPGDMGSGGRRR